MILDLRYYLAIFLRRFHYFLIVFAAVAAVAVAAAFTLPPVYVSEARMLVEGPQIPDELAATTVNTAALEQLQIIEQRLMTRANLLDIARRLRAVPEMETMTPDEVLAAMRRATRIYSQAGRDQATLMTVSFEAQSGQVAAGVVNEYVTLILRDSVEFRTDRAQNTLEFFEQEVARLSDELKRQSAKILEFQNANADALPDTLEYRLDQHSTLQERLTTTERDISGLNEQKSRLVQIFNATGQLGGTATRDTRTDEQKQLDSLRQELTSALAIYSAENPRVKLLQAQIAQLETVVKAQMPGGGTGGDSDGDGQTTILDLQLAEIDTRISQLTEYAAELATEIGRLKDTIDRTPANAIALAALERDYENVQTQYNGAVERLAKASTGERIEALSKGERITVLDAATVPNRPTKPDRVKIAAAGIVAGAGLGIGLIVLLEMLSGAVHRPSDLVARLGITPIGTIPFTRTPYEHFRRRLVTTSLVLVLVGGLPAALWAVHTYYQPLDLLIAKVGARIGL